MKRFPSTETKKRELVITRVLDAPRETVWQNWTEPEQMKLWWGPKDFTAPFIKIDLRVGGEYLNCMRSPENKDYWSKGTFREITPLKRLVMTDSFADEKGNIVPSSYYGMNPDWPRELLVRVTFEDFEGRTRMTLKHSGIRGMSDADIDNMRLGWNESIDKLTRHLAKV